MNKIAFILIILLAGVTGIVFFYQNSSPEKITAPVSSKPPQNSEEVEVIAQNLEVPWAIAFLSNGDMLVTQRKGEINLIAPNEDIKTIVDIDEVLQVGEGGLLGLTLHPDFKTNNYLYVYYTYEADGNRTLNRVVRFSYRDNKLTDRKVIVDEIPGASNHNGGRIKFGPDGYLYIATGDAQEPSLAQDTNSLAGKILRVTDEGKPAPDNPFNNLIFSYGHRNPQGLAFDGNELWAVEHGASAKDELNKIEPGKNYGWPVIQGTQQRTNMQTPVIQSGETTWAPGGLVFHNGIFYFTGLRGNALYSFDQDNEQKEVKEHFKNKYGRLREIILGPDGNFYITTSNQDGRGIPNSGDDKILRINPDSL